MYRMLAASLVLVVTVSSSGRAARAACGDPPDLLILLDRSGTMSLENKWTEAKTAINNMLTAFTGSIRFGLMLFPTSGTCTVNKIQVGCGDNTQAAVMSALNASSPTGNGTPIVLSLLTADAYLKTIDAGKTKYVLIITDGYENCHSSPTPAQAVTTLFNNGVKTYVVGFGTGVDANQLNSMASAGGTALSGTTKYYQASSQSTLNSALQSIASAVTCCGNGVIDSGEKCDPKISAGQTGACPTSCNDNKACTTDTLSGSGCSVTCTYTAITTAKNGDGCCPPGANSLTDSDCPVVCGNGLLESGETCDSAIGSGSGKCPTTADCNDSNVCTADSLSGSTCTVKCVNTALTAKLTVKDGCCPPGATSATDLDCTPGCGNGILETGETCDPKITSGTGKCPTLAECDDKNSCTVDTLAGSACALACSNLSVKPDATKSDGCCPNGANAITDKDCTASCGNGILEFGETCDTAIASGAGACKKASDCADQDSCTTDGLSGSGCTVSCANTPVSADKTQKDGCCPPGNSLLTDADCLKPCDPDETTNCVDLCKGVTCSTGQYCKEGKCVSFPDGGPGGGDGWTASGDGGIQEAGGPAGDGWSAEATGCDCRLPSAGGMGGGSVFLLLLGLAVAGLVLAARRRRG